MRATLPKAGPDRRASARDTAQFFMEGSFDAMLLVSAQQRVLDANSSALRMIGAPVKHLLGKRIETVLRLRPQRMVHPVQLAHPVGALDGSLFLLESASQKTVTVLLKKTCCKAGRSLWAMRDVSRIQPMVNALGKKNRLLVEAERVGRIGGWEFDPTTRRIIWTRQLQRLMGVRGDAMSVECSNSFYVGMSRNIVRDAFKATLAQGTPYDLELEVMTGDGRRLWIREVCRPRIRRGKLVSVVGVVQDISERRHMADLLVQSADRERMRIAADLHDGVGQELTGLALELSGAASEILQESPKAARDFALCADTARQALNRLREMSHGLIPVAMRMVDFNDLVRQLAASVRRAVGIQACFRFRGDSVHMPVGSTAEHLFRITQEAVANAIKHSGADAITITLTASASRLLLTISDNGSGMSPSAETRGVGLQLMGYRARLLGGVLAHVPMLKGGTRLSCMVPRVPTP